MGKVLFYVLWPLVWFYAPLRARACAVIRVDGEVLLVKNGFGPRIWQFPGGGIKTGENPIHAAVREVREEFSIDLDSKTARKLNQEFVVVRQKGLLLRNLYVLFDLDAKPQEVKPSKEIFTWQWASLSQSLPPEVETAKRLLRK